MTCQHVHTTDEGTSYCDLAENGVAAAAAQVAGYRAEADRYRAEADRLRALAMRLRDQVQHTNTCSVVYWGECNCPVKGLLADPEVRALGHHPEVET